MSAEAVQWVVIGVTVAYGVLSGERCRRLMKRLVLSGERVADATERMAESMERNEKVRE